MMADSLKLSPKFQISIPKAVRQKLEWKAGQKLAIIPHGKGVLIVPEPEIEDLLGIAEGADPTGYRDRDDRY